jgi:feruloyl esterase
MDRYVGVIMNESAMLKTSGAYIPPEKYPAIHDAVLQACDGLDGVKDGILENPLACRFDPKVLQCKAGEDTVSCLTAAQVQTAKMIYAPAKDAKTGKVLTGGLMPGTELQWGTLYSPTGYGNAIEAMKYIAMKDPNWELAQFNASTDVEKAQKGRSRRHSQVGQPEHQGVLRSRREAADVSGIRDSAGHLQQCRPLSRDGAREVGKQAEAKSVKLFMIPGMYHCQGGPGTDTWDKAAALDAWVTTGKSPDRIVASHLTDGKVDRTRPLCPFPKVAKVERLGQH